MIDALLVAVRDSLQSQNFGYGSAALCEITEDGHPPPRCGPIFLAVHEGPTRSTNDNCLMEYFAWSLTLTMRVHVPLDRVGDAMLASKLARVSGPRNPSFNSRVEQLRAWGHMNWKITVLPNQTPASANDNLVAWAPVAQSIYGFVEPARFRGADRPVLVGPEWFTAEPNGPDVGLKAEIRFEGARRMQPQTTPVGSDGITV